MLQLEKSIKKNTVDTPTSQPLNRNSRTIDFINQHIARNKLFSHGAVPAKMKKGGVNMNSKDVSKLAAQVGRVMARRRKMCGMTQAMLAEKLGITQDSLSRMEKGVMAPKFSRLPEVAHFLDCRVADLFREASPESDDWAAAIAEELRDLSPDGRELILNLVREIARSLRKMQESRTKGFDSSEGQA